MTRPALPVFITPSAARQIEQAAAWWSEHRPAAPGAVASELMRAFRLIERQPACGIPATSVKLRGVRRLLLRGIGYSLYYRVAPRKRQVEVLALWHARRATAPPL